MPLFMDRHDVSKEVTAENVAELHQADLKIQSQYQCKGLTYWFDEVRKTAFCLIEAPNAAAIREMHADAHGDVPHEIIEVDANIVESFLGRIEDPKKSQNVALNIINDPAFRCIVAVHFSITTLKENDTQNNTLKQSIVNSINRTDGRIVNYDFDRLLISFTTVSEAIFCAIEICAKRSPISLDEPSSEQNVQIGISTGVPVHEESGFFKSTIQTSKRLCSVNKASIVVTTEVKELFESENMNSNMDTIYTLDTSELSFLNGLMNFMDRSFQQEKLNVDDFTAELGYSKSQCYRNMIALVGKSPKAFLNEYRLQKSLQLLKHKDSTISEIAFAVGFNSASYFTKCFIKRFNISPLHLKAKNTLA